MIEPTNEQAAQCAIVQHDVIETINRLLGEGIALPVVLAGLGAACAATVACSYGPAGVSPWFARQSALSMGIEQAGGLTT